MWKDWMLSDGSALQKEKLKLPNTFFDCMMQELR